eukprot:gene7442-15222_t
MINKIKLPSITNVGDSKKDIKRLVRRGKANESCNQTSSSQIGTSSALSQLKRQPLDVLCECILPWRIFDDIDSRGDQSFPHVPVSFQSLDEYISIWKPMLLEEIKANVLSNLPNRFNDCSFLSGASTMFVQPLSNKISITNVEKLLMTYKDQKDKELCMMDLVLLTPENVSINKDQGRSQPSVYMIGLVTSNAKPDGNKGLIVAVSRCMWERFKCQEFATIPNEKQQSSSTMKCTPLTGLTSSWREFMSLYAMETMPLRDLILSGCGSVATPVDGTETPPLPPILSDPNTTPSPNAIGNSIGNRSRPKTELELGFELAVLDRDFRRHSFISENFRSHLDKSFNMSQQRAILKATTTGGFTLIQGPPGTGKTSTLIGILNCLHVKAYAHFYDLVLDAVLGEAGLRCRQTTGEHAWLGLVNSVAKAKPHILVTAPSNVAVDNVVQRILNDGFVDCRGSKYFPNLLRLGAGKGSHVKAVSLEDTMEQLFSLDDISRNTAQVDANSELKNSIQEIIRLQTLLMNLRTAWSSSSPLPMGWELRVMDNGRPYWVDHNSRTTSPTPPLLDKGNGIISPLTLSTLPEYIVYADKLTQLLDNLSRCNLRTTRYQTLYSSHRNSLENTVIEEAHIVFTTLNSAGHPSLEGSVFPLVVVDEAAQCVEASTLIPLRLGCEQCVLVGDPMQLPATVFSHKLKHCGYDRSLFERLSEKHTEVFMLDTQYRMVPSLSAFPSKTFYRNNLKDGDVVKSSEYSPLAQVTSQQSLKSTANNTSRSCFKPFIFFNLLSSRDAMGSKEGSVSRMNVEEAKLCASVLKTFLKEVAKCGCKMNSVAVITPYQDQLAELRRVFKKEGLTGKTLLEEQKIETASEIVGTMTISKSGVQIDNSGYRNVNGNDDIILPDIELNTVDAFQGREKDVVIISCVRASDSGGIGFLSDRRRMNVAITRAKYALFVVGRAYTLRSNVLWGELISHAEDKGALARVQNSSDNLNEVLSQMDRQASKVTTSKAVGGKEVSSDGLLVTGSSDVTKPNIENKDQPPPAMITHENDNNLLDSKLPLKRAHSPDHDELSRKKTVNVTVNKAESTTEAEEEGEIAEDF